MQDLIGLAFFLFIGTPLVSGFGYITGRFLNFPKSTFLKQADQYLSMYVIIKYIMPTLPIFLGILFLFADLKLLQEDGAASMIFIIAPIVIFCFLHFHILGIKSFLRKHQHNNKI